MELDTGALDYANLRESGADDPESDPHLSEIEVDQFLQSLKEPGKPRTFLRESTRTGNALKHSKEERVI